MKKASWILSAVAITAFVSQAVAQEKAPAPMPPDKGAVIVQPAPAHGYAAPNYKYQPECCDHGDKGGCFGGAELTLLKPHFAGGRRNQTQDGDDPGFQNEGTFSYEPGVRGWVGWVNCDGFGARITGWWMSASNSFDFTDGNEDFEDDVKLETTAIDLEAIGVWCGGNLSITGGAGIRFARVNTNFDRLIVEDDNQTTRSVEFQGYGPTLSVDVSYSGGGCLGGYVKSRMSILLGSTDVELHLQDGDGNPTFRMTEEDDMTVVLEIGLGLVYRTCIGGCDVFVRAGVEAQAWLEVGNAHAFPPAGTAYFAFQEAPSAHGFDESYAFAGGVLAIGLRR